jgi:uncharacterized protein (DUF2267 family)
VGEQVLAAIERAMRSPPPGVDGAAAFTAVMCILAQRLSGGEARHISLALPSTLRSLVTPCALHRDEPAEPFGSVEFFRRVAAHLGTSELAAEAIAHAVFASVKRILPLQEIEDIASQLPLDLRALWVRGS